MRPRPYSATGRPISGDTVSCRSPFWEAVGQHPEGEQRGEQGLDAGVAEAQRGGALAVDEARSMEIVERSGSDGAVAADVLDAQQAPVGGEADLFQIFEVFSRLPTLNGRCLSFGQGVVDHGLGARARPSLCRAARATA